MKIILIFVPNYCGSKFSGSKNKLTSGRNVNMLYLWFCIEFDGNFRPFFLPIPTERGSGFDFQNPILKIISFLKFYSRYRIEGCFTNLLSLQIRRKFQRDLTGTASY